MLHGLGVAERDSRSSSSALAPSRKVAGVGLAGAEQLVGESRGSPPASAVVRTPPEALKPPWPASRIASSIARAAAGVAPGDSLPVEVFTKSAPSATSASAAAARIDVRLDQAAGLEDHLSSVAVAARGAHAARRARAPCRRSPAR